MIEDDGEGGVRIHLKVVPGARRDQIAGVLATPGGDRLKVRVSAPPEGGKGTTSPEKTVGASGVEPARARQALLDA